MEIITDTIASKYNIKLIKFSNGEEIVGDVTEVKALEGYKIENAIRIVIMPPQTPEGKPVVGFAAFIPYVDDKVFTIQRKDIMLIATPSQVIVDQWKAIFLKSTSLWVPPVGGIKGLIGGTPDNSN